MKRTSSASILLAAALLAASCGDDDGGGSTATTDAPAGTSAPAPSSSAPTSGAPAPSAPASGAPSSVAPSSSAGTGTNAGGGDELVIGIAIAQTGFFSDFDGPVAAGIELAVDELNANGGIGGRMVRLEVADTRSDPNLIQQAALDVLDAGADILVTSCDYDLGGPAARVAGERGIAALGCASSPQFGVEGVGDLAFNTSSGTPTEAAVMATFAEKQGYRRPYLLEDLSLDYTRSTCEFFERAWEVIAEEGEIVGRDTFQNEDASVASQVTALGDNADADVVVVCSYPPGGASVIRQIRAAGIELPIIVPDSFDGTFWLEGVPNASDIFHTAPGSLFGDDPEPRINEFFAAVEEATGEPPQSGFGLYGVTAVELITMAVETTGTTEGAALAEALESLTDADLTLGPTTYTDACHTPVGRPLRIVEIQDGESSFVEVLGPAALPEENC